MITGFNSDGEFVAQCKANIQVNGTWITAKRAKNTLRKQGAVSFVRDKIWEKEDGRQ